MPYKDLNKRRKYNRKYQIKWRKEHSEQWKKIQSNYYWRHKKERISQKVKYNRRRYHKYKWLALVKYGGNPPKCACCGESHYEFLTIDHIKGGGSKHRKEMMNKYDGGLYAFLVKTRKKPKQYQVLCMNCNMAKFHYGQCPHQNE